MPSRPGSNMMTNSLDRLDSHSWIKLVYELRLAKLRRVLDHPTTNTSLSASICLNECLLPQIYNTNITIRERQSSFQPNFALKSNTKRSLFVLWFMVNNLWVPSHTSCNQKNLIKQSLGRARPINEFWKQALSLMHTPLMHVNSVCHTGFSYL